MFAIAVAAALFFCRRWLQGDRDWKTKAASVSPDVAHDAVGPRLVGTYSQQASAGIPAAADKESTARTSSGQSRAANVKAMAATVTDYAIDVREPEDTASSLPLPFLAIAGSQDFGHPREDKALANPQPGFLVKSRVAEGDREDAGSDSESSVSSTDSTDDAMKRITQLSRTWKGK
jgi:hypothetical protein